MTDSEIISKIVSEWLKKPVLRKYARIGKKYIQEQEKSK